MNAGCERSAHVARELARNSKAEADPPNILAFLLVQAAAWAPPSCVRINLQPAAGSLSTRVKVNRLGQCRCALPRPSPPPPPGQPRDELSIAAAAAMSAAAETSIKAMISRTEADFQRAFRFLSPVVATLTRRDFGPAPGPAGRATDWICACALAVAASELLQFTMLLTLGWLLGAGCWRPPPWTAWLGSTPLAEAAQAALASRGPTRPLRLVAEAIAARRYLLTVRIQRISGRVAFTAQRILLAAAIATGLVSVLAFADASLLARGGGIPAARVCRFLYVRTLGALSRSLGIGAGSGHGVERAVNAVARALVDGTSWIGLCLVRLEAAARSVKPLRAVLDLFESDVWVADAVASAARKLRRALPPAVAAAPSVVIGALWRVAVVGLNHLCALVRAVGGMLG